MKSKILAWVNDKIKDNDRFATPILLNYKGKTSFKTMIGGIGSIFIHFILIAYSVILMIQMVKRDGSVINSTTKI